MRFALSNDGNLCGFVVPGQFFFNFYISGMIPTNYPDISGGGGVVWSGVQIVGVYGIVENPRVACSCCSVYGCAIHSRKWLKSPSKSKYRGIVWGGCFGCQ